MTTTLQTTLEGEIYYKNHCKYCGKGFIKTHNHQLYCSEKCRKNSRKEQKAAYQRNRRKLVREGKLVVSDQEKYNKYASNLLSQHRHKDFKREYRAIQREMKRLKLK